MVTQYTRAYGIQYNSATGNKAIAKKKKDYINKKKGYKSQIYNIMVHFKGQNEAQS